MLGHKELAPDSTKGAEHPLVRNLVGSELALDHVGTGRLEYAHRINTSESAA